MNDAAPIYPFTALVGQERIQRALLLCAVHPRIGGLLLRGHRGAAKTTAARALASLLPPRRVVAGCPFGCAADADDGLCDRCAEARREGRSLEEVERPTELVELPLGATEDRLLGSLDLGAALARGEHRFEPGLLARANGALLYVDEVNLLPDHLVDLLLDVAASGVNVVEREGFTLRHPSRFLIIGSMNPEEGELRPQLLDRFGLCVEVVGSEEVSERAEVARRRLEFEAAPAAFAARWDDRERRLARQVAEARGRLGEVRIPDGLWEQAGRLSLAFKVEGHRADLAMIKAAAAAAALDGRLEATLADLGFGADLALAHRVERHGLRGGELDRDRLARLVAEAEADDAPDAEGRASGGLKKKTSPL